jgi:hypothetical protein
MSIVTAFDRAMTYISTGVGRIFSPTQDDYPKTGVQPFSGEIDRHKKHRHG